MFKELEAFGKTYPSVTQFCIEYGLKLTSVYFCLRNNMSPEEIVEKMHGIPQASRYQMGSDFGKKCSFEQLSFPSLRVACSALGLPLQTAYTLMAEKKCSSSDVIKLLMSPDSSGKPKIPYSEDIGDRMAPVTIGEKLFSSKSEACASYGIPYLSVRTWMEKTGEPFDVAILSIWSAQKDANPFKSYWNNSADKLMPLNSQTDCGNLHNLTGFLESNGYKTSSYYVQGQKVMAIHFVGHLRLRAEPRDIYCMFRHPDARPAITVEFVIPHLLCLDSGIHCMQVDKLINELNATYTGAQTSICSHHVLTKSTAILSSQRPKQDQFFATLNRLIRTSAEIFDIVCTAVKNMGLYDACFKHNSPLCDVLLYKAKTDCNDNEALTNYRCVQTKEIPQPDTSRIEPAAGAAKPVIIDGVPYRSRQDACAAYGLRYISVKSRMNRQKLSFEEALLTGGLSKRSMAPSRSNWDIVKKNMVQQEMESNKSEWAKIAEVLQKASYVPKCYYNEQAGYTVLSFSEPLISQPGSLDIFILVPSKLSGKLITLELIIPRLMKCIDLQGAKERKLLETINNCMNVFSGTRVYYSNGWLNAGSIITLHRNITQKQLLESLHQFIGTAITAKEMCEDFMDADTQ